MTHDSLPLDAAGRRRLVGLCAVISGDGDAAEDLAQETLLEGWRNAHKLADPAGAERWLAAIARNVCRRWARRRGRALPVVAEPVEQGALEDELDRAQLADLVERALAELPPGTREVVVHRFVDDQPYAEIAERLGISEDAVSMRLSRGRSVLRRLLETELEDQPERWNETRLWCVNCGRQRLSMKREEAPATIAFRCPACNTGAERLEAEFRLDNPCFKRLFGALKRPATIRARGFEWSLAYYRSGIAERQVVCTRCGAQAALRPHVRDESERRGVLADCRRCGEQAWLSTTGIALALPEVRRFRREHPRVETLPQRSIDFDGAPSVLVAFRDLFGSARAEAIFGWDSVRLLHVCISG